MSDQFTLGQVVRRVVAYGEERDCIVCELRRDRVRRDGTSDFAVSVVPIPDGITRDDFGRKFWATQTFYPHHE